MILLVLEAPRVSHLCAFLPTTSKGVVSSDRGQNDFFWSLGVGWGTQCPEVSQTGKRRKISNNLSWSTSPHPPAKLRKKMAKIGQNGRKICFMLKSTQFWTKKHWWCLISALARTIEGEGGTQPNPDNPEKCGTRNKLQMLLWPFLYPGCESSGRRKSDPLLHC